MKRCAFLTMDSLDNFCSYDAALLEPLAGLDWQAESVSWKRGDTDWNRFDLVIIRSTWDYQHFPQDFLKTLQEIDRSKARLENSLELVEWNMNKSYLRDLESRGVNIVPSAFPEECSLELLLSLYDRFSTNELIIKPLISANADNTLRVRKETLTSSLHTIRSVFTSRSFMVQPFMPNILTEGEYSLIYFGGDFSHALLKKPKSGDFRVQEEHGGILYSIHADPVLQDSAQKVLNALDEVPLYARVDLVRNRDDEYFLMELELIEPSLYFNMDEASAGRFARVVDLWMNSKL